MTLCKTCKYNKDNYCEYWEDNEPSSTICSAFEKSNIKRYKDVVAWSVMLEDSGSPKQDLSYFMFDTKKEALKFKGKRKADIVKVRISQI